MITAISTVPTHAPSTEQTQTAELVKNTEATSAPELKVIAPMMQPLEAEPPMRQSVALAELTPEEIPDDPNDKVSHAAKMARIAQMQGVLFGEGFLQISTSDNCTISTRVVKRQERAKNQIKIQFRATDKHGNSELAEFLQSDVLLASSYCANTCSESDKRRGRAKYEKINDELVNIMTTAMWINTHNLLEDFYYNRANLNGVIDLTVTDPLSSIPYVYSKIVDSFHNPNPMFGSDSFEDDSQYAICETRYQLIAAELDMSTTQLSKILIENNLLILTESSEGYQRKCRKKADNKLEKTTDSKSNDIGNFYCVRKIIEVPSESLLLEASSQ